MPMRSRSGILGDPWAYCDRCGWQYRQSQMQMQNGLLLCPKDVDAIEMMIRDQQVAEFFANAGPEAENTVGLVRQNPNNIKDNF